MIWSIAADDALVGFAVDTFLVNHNAGEMSEETLRSIVIRSRNVRLEDCVDFLYAGVEEWGLNPGKGVFHAGTTIQSIRANECESRHMTTHTSPEILEVLVPVNMIYDQGVSVITSSVRPVRQKTGNVQSSSAPDELWP